MPNWLGLGVDVLTAPFTAPYTTIKNTVEAWDRLAHGDTAGFVDKSTSAGLSSIGMPNFVSDYVGEQAGKIHESAVGSRPEKVNLELSKEVNDVINRGDTANKEIWKPLQDASEGRSMSSSLDTYDEKTRANIGAIDNLQDAGTRTQDYLDPMVQYASDSVGNIMDDSASNATNRAIANAKLSGWNTANRQAMTDAALGANAIGSSQNIIENTLENDIQPTQDLIKYQSDWNTDKLQSNIDLAKSKALVSAMDDGLLGEAKDAVNTMSGVFKFL